jgi:phospholipid transport system substrate-binding protein
MRANDSSIIDAHLADSVVSVGVIVLILGFLLVAEVCIFTAASVVQGSTGGDPMTMVKNTVNQVIDILRDHQTPQDDRRRKLLEVVAGHFDFTDMARSSLGYQWRNLTPDQQQRFVPLFTAFIEDAYLNKIQDYSGQKIEFLNETSNGGDWQVRTRVLQPNSEQPIPLDYRLKRQGGDWKVYDVTVDDISITANYRNQFNRVINDQGFDALMNEMRSKQQELIASLGK